jgi:hypothetical protein
MFFKHQFQKLVTSKHKRQLSTYNFTVFDMATVHSYATCGMKQQQNLAQTSWQAACFDFIGKGIK